MNLEKHVRDNETFQRSTCIIMSAYYQLYAKYHTKYCAIQRDPDDNRYRLIYLSELMSHRSKMLCTLHTVSHHCVKNEDCRSEIVSLRRNYFITIRILKLCTAVKCIFLITSVDKKSRNVLCD